jgi:glycosyltransferase involved in cell wall biosynthesis
MKVGFYVPPARQRIGGLDQAILGLQQHLDCSVELEPADPSACDIIHFHGLWQPRFRALAVRCESESIPYVVSPHGMLEPWAWQHKWWKKFPYYFLFERKFLAGAAGIVATSDLEKKNLQRFGPFPAIDVIPLSITAEHGPEYAPARRSLGWADDEFVLLFLSRLHQKKGLHLLLLALRKLSLPKSALRVAVVGDGSKNYKQRLARFIRLNRSRLPAIEFFGPIWGPEKWLFLQGADLFCLPSFSENFGLVILEACQVGTPVLTTVETPWQTLLQERGFPVVRPSAEAILGGMTYFLERGKTTPAERHALAQQVHRKFAPRLVSDQYLNYYRAITRACCSARFDHR